MDTEIEKNIIKLKNKCATNQTGGKGTLRRKRKVVKRKRFNNVENPNERVGKDLINKLMDLNNNIDLLEKEQYNKYAKYVEIFKNEECNKINKKYRKNNKSPHQNELRDKLSEMFSLTNKERLPDDLSKYILTNISDNYLLTFIQLVNVYNEVLYNSQEYTLFDNINDENDDQTLQDSFQYLKLDYSNPLSPTQLRGFYVEKMMELKSKEVKNREKNEDTTNSKEDIKKDCKENTNVECNLEDSLKNLLKEKNDNETDNLKSNEISEDQNKLTKSYLEVLSMIQRGDNDMNPINLEEVDLNNDVDVSDISVSE